MTSPAFDLIGLTQLRNDPRYRGIDGEIDNGQNLAVAVIDTGIQGDHPLLDDNFTAYVDFVNTVGSDLEPFTNASQSRDTGSHGTHVAGTVGSEDESIGVATGVDLISLGVFPEDGGASNQDIIEALQWVLDNRNQYNIVAVNMSLGSSFYTSSEASEDPYAEIINQLEQAGITVVSAAGNSYDELPQDVPLQNVASPAIVSTLAVGAVYPGSWFSFREPDEITNFSQRLQFDRMIFAPGANINSTVPDNGTDYKQGTSMASPMVAGAVALLQEAALQFGNRKLTPLEVREILLQTADRIIDGDDESFQQSTEETFLRMNVYNAVQEVERRLSSGNPNPNPDPTPTDPSPTDPNGIISSAISLENDINITLEQLNQLTTVASDSIGIDEGTIEVGATDVDLFSFNVTDAGGLVTIQTTVNDASNQVDTILRLFDASGNEITIDDDGGEGRFSRIEAILEPGQYFAGVSGFDNAYYNPTVINSGISGGTGSYSLQLQFASGIAGSTTDENGTISDSVVTNFLIFDELEAQYVEVNIASDSVAGVSERVAVGRTDVDMIRFDVDSAGLMVLETFESDPDDRLDSVLRLFDASGNELTFNDDGGQGFFSRIETELNPGTYYVGVSGFDNSNYDPNSLDGRVEGSTGTATLEFFFQPSGNTDPNGIRIGAEEIELTPGTTTVLYDSIGSDFGIEVNDADVDLFEFVAPETGILLIDTDTPFLNNFADTLLRLFDANGNEIGYSDDDPGLDINGNQLDFPIGGFNEPSYDAFGNFIGHGGDSFLPAFVEAGQTYFIGVSGYGNGSYSIDNLDNRSTNATGGLYDLYLTYVTSLDEDGAIATATEITSLPLQVNGNIGFDALTDVGNNDVDFYKVNSAQGGLLDIQINAFAEFDSMVFLFDEQGNELAFNDDSPFSVDSELQYFIDANTNYYIAVSGYGNFYFDPNIAGSGFGGSTGDYALNAQVLQPEESNSNSNIYLTAFNNALESNGGSLSNFLLDVDREIFGANFDQLDTNSLDYLELGTSITASLGEDILGFTNSENTNAEFSSFTTLYTTEVSAAIFGNSQNSSFNSGADDVDYFRISINEAGRYDLRTLANTTEFGTLAANTSLRLYDDQGNQISDNQNTVDVPGTDSRVLVSINQPGDYWIAVLPEAEATQSFDFQSHSFGTLTDDEVQQLSQSAGEYELSANRFTLQSIGTPVFNDGGISIEFNDVLNLDRLSLYDGPDAETLDLSSLTVVDSNGNPVRGSLVVENNQVIFVPTNPLDAGNYTLTYNSNDFMTQFGSENSQYQSQEMLDGDGDGTPGGDLSANISVADSNAILLTVPSFARGPGQAVDIGQVGTGLPISVSNAEGFTDIRLRLEYNPELLNITDIVLASGLPGDWQRTGLEISDGQVIVDLAGTTALEAGATNLIKLVANVPETATFNSSQVLRVSGVAIDENRNPIALEESAAVHKVAFLADPNADGIIDFGDVLAVANLFLSDDISGFDRFDLTDPVLLGDANLDNIVDFGDVLAVAQEFLDDSSLIPSADNTLVPEVPIGPDPEVTISSATAQPGESVSVTVSLTDTSDAPDGVATFNLGIRYPTDQLNITASDIQLSPELTSLGFQVLGGITVDEAAGFIRFGSLSLTGNSIPQGATPTIATLNFSVPEGATPREVTIDLSEDPTETGLFDASSTRLTLTAVDGNITIAGAVNTPPTITSNPTFSVAENTTTDLTITAEDAEGNDLTFNLVGGADQGLFT
ncbi:MAG: DVUA0089 family protein, partial [Cyanobacteria bacterium J06633_8]